MAGKFIEQCDNQNQSSQTEFHNPKTRSLRANVHTKGHKAETRHSVLTPGPFCSSHRNLSKLGVARISHESVHCAWIRAQTKEVQVQYFPIQMAYFSSVKYQLQPLEFSSHPHIHNNHSFSITRAGNKVFCHSYLYSNSVQDSLNQEHGSNTAARYPRNISPRISHTESLSGDVPTLTTKSTGIDYRKAF